MVFHWAHEHCTSIIDMQNAFLNEYNDSVLKISNACEVINYCSQLMRNINQTVINVLCGDSRAHWRITIGNEFFIQG
jgi:isochorismate hydrolase